MTIQCIGINHNTAPVSIRERLALDKSQIRAMLARCGCGERESVGRYSELILLSTCNRVEAYAVSSLDSFNDLKALLAESTDITPEEIAPYLYQFSDMDAARHLFRVAAGLDSMVLGEPQILGQVAEAYTLSLSIGSSGLILSRLFQAAIHAAKRAQHETAISANPVSVSSVAVHLVASVVKRLDRSNVLVVGAGETAELAVEALRKRGVQEITVVNRSVDRARALADRWGAQAKSFETLGEHLSQADVVICSTGAPHTLFDQELVGRAMAGRSRRSMVMVDLAVPRDIDEDVRELEGVYVYDIDQLQERQTQSVTERESEIPHVEAILDDELRAFARWRRCLAIRPVIKALHQQAEAVRRQEVSKTLRKMSNLTEEAEQQIDALTRALVKKLLHQPTSCLKEQSLNGQAAKYALFAREFFGLETSSEDAEGHEA